jgi:Flp pilus assembly protein protease CpaA
MILKSDIQKSIIKNLHLLLLLWIYILYSLVVGVTFTFSYLWLFFSITIGFFLYYFKVWWAGDSKYFIILSLFLLESSVFSYIGNLSLVTIGFLLLHIIKNFLFPNSLWLSLAKIIQADAIRNITYMQSLFHDSPKKWYMYLLGTVNNFLLFFLVFKIVRSVINQELDMSSYGLNIIFFKILALWVIFFLLQRALLFAKNKTIQVCKISKIEANTYFSFFLFIIIIPLLAFDYRTDAEVFFATMRVIFTLSFCIYMIIKISIYLYRKVFIDMEKSIIELEQLQAWDLLDSTWIQSKSSLLKEIWLYDDLQRGTTDKQDMTQLKKLLIKSWETHISILLTFPYAPLIFTWFVITYVYGSFFIDQLIVLIEKILL